MLQFSNLQAWHHTGTASRVLTYFWCILFFNMFSNLKKKSYKCAVSEMFTFIVLVFITRYKTIFTNLASKCLSAFWHPFWYGPFPKT
jgi:hypothetical protein